MEASQTPPQADQTLAPEDVLRLDHVEGRTVVRFGNSAPLMQVDLHDDEGNVTGRTGVPAKHIDKSVTTAIMELGFDDQEFVDRTLSTDNDRVLVLIARNLSAEDRKYAIGIQQMEQILAEHSGNSKPDWIVSSDQNFAEALGRYFNCSVGEPVALLTNAGRDALHAQHIGTGAQPAAFNYMALTASVTAPAATDTVLTGEITTAGGGLVRAQATYAHTAGTNTSTLTKTFTANGSDALPVTVAQIGVLNAAAAGTLGYHTALNSTATLTNVGDNVTITWTDTAG